MRWTRGCTLLDPFGPPFVRYQPAHCRRDHEWYVAGSAVSTELIAVRFLARCLVARSSASGFLSREHVAVQKAPRGHSFTQTRRWRRSR
jgi:hypothetical protein